MPKKQIRLDLRERLASGLTRAGNFFAGDRNEHVVQFGRIEERFFDDTLERWPRFHQLAADGVNTLPHFEDFLIDVFMGLYQPRPYYRGIDEIKPSHKINKELMDQTQHTKLWDEARSHSALNRVNSMIGLLYVGEAILNGLPEENKQQAQQRQQRIDRLQELIDNAQQAAQGSNDAAAAAAADALEEALDALDAPGIDDDLARRLMKRGLKQANEDLKEFEEMQITWGSSPGEFNAMPPDQAMDLYDKMRKLPNLRKFADELGRMRQHAIQATMALYSQEPHEIVSITTGGRWHEIIPSERIMLVDPDLEAFFWMRFVQEANLSWAYRGKQAAGKGPFIICLDVSGSTWGNREIWGKAFAIAGIELAARQTRDVAIIMFDAEVKEDGIFVIPGGRASLQEKVDIAAYYTGGGTNFVEPLRIAVENIQERLGGWESADIILVTDGEYRCSDEFIIWFRAACEQMGIRVQGVLLDGHLGMLPSLEPLCDRVVSVQSFQGTGPAVEIFSHTVGSH